MAQQRCKRCKTHGGKLREVEVSPYTLTEDLWGVALSDIQGDDVELVGNELHGTLKKLTGDNAITRVWGEGYFVALTFTPSAAAVKTEVGIKNLAELDPDNSALIKVEDMYGTKLRVVQTDTNGKKFESYFNLDQLTLDEGE